MAKSTKKQAKDREEERMRRAVRRAAGVKDKKKSPNKVVRNSTVPHKNGLPKGPGKNPCACGCGGTTNSMFQQGHDARVYSVLRKIVTKHAKVGDLPEAVRADKKLLASMKAKVH